MPKISYLIYICPDSSSRTVLRSHSSESTLVFLVLTSNPYLLNLLTLTLEYAPLRGERIFLLDAVEIGRAHV